MTTLTQVRLVMPLVLVVLTTASFAQSVLYTFDGDSPGDIFNNASGAGDVNGDGFDALIVGAWYDDNNGTNSGSARVFSGLDGSVLYTFNGDSAHDLFGSPSSGAGDVNGDGYADLIVGAQGDDPNGSSSGSARVFSGVDGSILYTFDGDSAGDDFGGSCSGAGDVNGDGYADLIVGSARDSNNGTFSGSARVFSGLDGSVLYLFNGDSPNDFFGVSVSGAGDVNGDGFADLIVGAHRDGNNGFLSGSARVFSGVDGSVLYTFDGDSPDDVFGGSVSGAGDVNADGYDDLIVGSKGFPFDGPSPGYARVFSGLDGGILYTFDGDSPGDYFGSSVSCAGDVNGDGFADLIVGAVVDDNNGQWSGSARVFSGVDGSVLYTLDGDSPGDLFGSPVSGAGDVNGDGYDDLIVGIPLDDNNGTDSGSARVFSGTDIIGTNYCGPANLNSTGQSAAIIATGSVLVQKNMLTLTARQLTQQKFGYFLDSETQGFVPFAGGSQGNLCLGGQIGRFAKQIQSSGASGEFSIQVDLTQLPTPSGPHVVLAGETWNFQAWYRDKNPGNTSNFTDGVSILFQ